MAFGFLMIITAWLAYANGANDNAKGVATLIGSRIMSAQSALRLAAIATLAGSMCTLILAASLVSTFGGTGLVPDSILQNPLFPITVLFASAATVMLATKIGIPISTTHAMTGALVGAGVAACFSQVNFLILGIAFAAPLILGPAVAICLTGSLYFAIHAFKRSSRQVEESCVCVDVPTPRIAQGVPSSANPSLASATLEIPTVPQIKVGQISDCREAFGEPMVAIQVTALANGLHIFSGAALSFVRGVNDTAKIVGPVLLIGGISPHSAVVVAGLAMAAGGLVSSRKVAATMSEKITDMNQGQSLTANVVSSFLVILASRFGLPVSTTHVSCGSLFGIGMVTRKANMSTIGTILLAWITTIPIALILGLMIYWIGNHFM